MASLLVIVCEALMTLKCFVAEVMRFCGKPSLGLLLCASLRCTFVPWLCTLVILWIWVGLVWWLISFIAIGRPCFLKGCISLIPSFYRTILMWKGSSSLWYFFARDRCFLRIAFPFEFLIVSPDCFVFCLFPVWTLLFVVAGIQLKAVALLSSFASSRFKAIVTPGGSSTSRL